MNSDHRGLIAFSIVIWMTVSASGQRGNVYQLDFRNIYNGEAVDVYDLREKETEGEGMYYFEEWYDVQIKFRDGKLLSGYKGRFDLLLQSVEVRRKADVVEVPSALIDEFIIEKTLPEGQLGIDTVRFVRVNDPRVDVAGFLEILVSGDLSLLSGTDLQVLTPNYIATHDAGSLSTRYVRKDVLFVSSGDRLDKIDTRRKVAAQLLEGYKRGAKKYIMNNKVNFKKTEEVVQLIEQLNGFKR